MHTEREHVIALVIAPGGPFMNLTLGPHGPETGSFDPQTMDDSAEAKINHKDPNTGDPWVAQWFGACLRPTA